jgi:hypothetical protein
MTILFDKEKLPVTPWPKGLQVGLTVPQAKALTGATNVKIHQFAGHMTNR